MVLLTVLKKARKHEQEMRLLILGLDNSGKTTFLNKINGEDISKIAPTFGFNIKSLEYSGWKLNCWDVGGQQSLRSFWRNYFERTDAVVWVVDSADTARLARQGFILNLDPCKHFSDCARELHSLVNEECLHGVTLLVMANKSDLPGSLDAETITELLRLNDIRQHHWKIFETSAHTGQNLLEALDWLCRDVASRVLVPE